MAGFVGLFDGTGLPVGVPSSHIDVTGAVLEVVTATPAAGQGISGAALETVVATSSGQGVSGVVLETVVAADIDSTRISGVVLELVVAANSSEVAVTGVVLEIVVGRLRIPEDPPVSRYTDIAEARFGRDLELLPPDQAPSPTATGDYPSIGGRPNLHAAVRRRLLTSPGQLVHRPDYGGGLELFVGRLGTPGERARLAAGSRANILRDSRLAQAVVGVGESPTGPDQVLVEVAIQPAGEIETDTVSILSDR